MIQKDIVREWQYKGKYDAEIAELASKGWGGWKIYSELQRRYKDSLDISLPTVIKRVRHYRKQHGMKSKKIAPHL